MSDELPDTDPPFYFRRVYQGPSPLDEVMTIQGQPDGSFTVVVEVPKEPVPTLPVKALAPVGLVIYGRAVLTPDDPDDTQVIAEEAKRGLIFSQCFSVAAPEGELGFHPLAVLSEISFDDWENARLRGWEP